MKMVKSLLLGTAAGLVAMTGAQAADLPVKAKPVQYVKICSLYGAGFYYIPGTDMCLKMGGWVRFEDGYHGGNSLTFQSFGQGWQNNRTTTNDNTMRTRGYITADARNQSEYGTIRSYIAVGLNYDSPAAATGGNFNRAFIQFAGFTFGTSQSFYDFFSTSATSYWAAYPASDTGDPGWKVAAYTAQFGGGLSATLSIEEPRANGTWNASGAIAAIGATLNGSSASPGTPPQTNQTMPDVVANLRVDQAWGSAQIMGALHRVNTGYYGATNVAGNGHPEDAYGFALGGGLKFLAPSIGPGDYFQIQGNYTQGAMKYASFTANGSYSPANIQGSELAYGYVADGVYGIIAGTGTSVELTTAWNVNMAYEHFWNKQWKTSIYGGYLDVSFNNNANFLICAKTPGATAACDQNWNQWWIGTRTQWNVTRDTYLGLDVFYQQLQSSTNGSVTGTIVPATIAGYAAGTVFNQADLGQLGVRFRAHRDFYP